MAAVPVAKLGALLVKTLAKPVAGAIKARAKDHPQFRSTCIAMAQTYHRLEIQMRRRLYGQVDVDAYIAPLNEQIAVDTAADFLGEGVVFSVAVGVLAFEYGRQSLKEAAKEARQAEEIRVLQERQLDLAQRINRLEEHHRDAFSLFKRAPAGAHSTGASPGTSGGGGGSGSARGRDAAGAGPGARDGDAGARARGLGPGGPATGPAAGTAGGPDDAAGPAAAAPAGWLAWWKPTRAPPLPDAAPAPPAPPPA